MDVEIDKIETSAAIIKPGSWKIMERLGFFGTGEKNQYTMTKMIIF